VDMVAVVAVVVATPIEMEVAHTEVAEEEAAAVVLTEVAAEEGAAHTEVAGVAEVAARMEVVVEEDHRIEEGVEEAAVDRMVAVNINMDIAHKIYASYQHLLLVNFA